MSKQFDLTVHKRNKKGYVTGANPYRLVIDNGKQLFERPPGSGVYYNAKGEIEKAPKGFVVPQEVEADDKALKLAEENEALKIKLAKLEAEQLAKVDAIVEEAKAEAAQEKQSAKPSFIKK